MSNSQYQTYETYGPNDPYGAVYDPHSAEAVPYGVQVAPTLPTPPMPVSYEDTYRPAYERPEAPAPVPHPGASRRAARRRKGRGAERADTAMRRLLPQALVVAFLAGGTTAFVAKDKAIELTVDGKPRTLHTFADDVTELLADEGVDVGAHDVVAPAPGTELSSGDEIAVHYGRPVRLTLDGERREVWTTARTVDGALKQLGVRAEGAYVSTSRSRPIGREGLTLDVRTERAVTVMADGRSRTVRTNAATVGRSSRRPASHCAGRTRRRSRRGVFRVTGRPSPCSGSPGPRRSARRRSRSGWSAPRTPRCSGARRSSSRRGRRGCGGSRTPCGPSTASGRSRGGSGPRWCGRRGRRW